MKVKWKSLSHVWLFVTPWTIQSREFFQILEWVVVLFTGSPQPRGQIQISHIAGRFFTSWATREAPFPTHTHTYTHAHTHTHTDTHIYTYIYTHTHIYICIYTHTYIHIYTHTHIYIHICIYILLVLILWRTLTNTKIIIPYLSHFLRSFILHQYVISCKCMHTQKKIDLIIITILEKN